MDTWSQMSCISCANCSGRQEHIAVQDQGSGHLAVVPEPRRLSAIHSFCLCLHFPTYEMKVTVTIYHFEEL